MKQLILLLVFCGFLFGQGRGDPYWRTIGFGSSVPGSCSGKVVWVYTDGSYRYCIAGSFANPFSGFSATWGAITGTLSGQTDLQSALNAKQNSITTGTTGQYLRGDLSLATFPSIPTITGSAVLKGSSGNAAAAASSDVIALFASGSCSGYLKSDGSCSTPAGGGDFSSNTSTSVVGEILLFADTSGKLGKRAAASGIAKLASGVLGTASAGTDYSAPIASGTIALATSSIASEACTSAQTGTATGTLTTDTILFTANADITAVTGYAPLTAGGLAIYPYPTSDTVNFKVCNPTTSSITPGAVTLNWKVIR